MPTISPNPAGFQFDVEKDTQTPPGTPASILPLVVMGYCTDTTNAPVGEPVPLTEPSAAQTAGGQGPAVELAAGALDPNGRVSLVHLLNTGATNAATYGAVTQTWEDAAPPVASVDSVVLPEDDFDVKIRWTVGGFAVGTAGNKYRVSLDGGLHYFAELALGTATTITIPFGGGKINLDPPLTALLTYVNELVDDAEDHFTNVTGSVHGGADAGPYTISGTAATQAAAITRFNQILAAAILHVQKTTSSIHGASDTTALTALQAITTPTTGQALLTAALAFEAAFFGDGATANSGHTLRTTSSIHGAQDPNLVAATTPTRGVITAEDTIEFSTNAPTPDATEIAAAFQALRTYTGEFGTIVIAAPIEASYIETIRDELVELWKRNKFPNVIAFFRRPTLAETTTSYEAALADLDGIVCVDVAICSGAVYHQSALINTADGKATPRRPQWWVAMAAARSEPETCIQLVAPQQGVRIRDSRGRLLPGCLDEASGNLYSVAHRTIGTKTDTVRDANGGVFVTQDLVLYDANSDWILRAYSAVVNAELRAAAPVVVFASTPPNGFPSAPAEPLDAESQASIKADVDAVLQPEFVGKRRCTQVVFSLVESTAASLKYKIVTVPNFYPINGISLKASVSLERVVA